MNQTIDYKKLSYQIGVVLADLLTIVGGIFTLVSMIEMKNYSRLESSYYDLLMMKTYGIAMMIGGFIGWFANILMLFFANRTMTSKKTTVKNEKNTEASSVCAICGAKSTRLKTVTVGDNEKIRLCPQCCSEENGE